MNRKQRREKERREKKINKNRLSLSEFILLGVKKSLKVVGYEKMGFTLLYFPEDELSSGLCNYISAAERDSGTILLYELASKIDLDFPTIQESDSDKATIESSSEILAVFKGIVLTVVEAAKIKTELIGIVYDLHADSEEDPSMMHYFSTVSKKDTINMLDATSKRLREKANIQS